MYYIFNKFFYFKNYPDVRNHHYFSENPIKHWLKFGKNENRKCCQKHLDDFSNNIINNNLNILVFYFNKKYYLDKYPDIKKNNLYKKNAIKHWIKYGIYENRYCSLEHEEHMIDNKINNIKNEIIFKIKYIKCKKILILKNKIKNITNENRNIIMNERVSFSPLSFKKLENNNLDRKKLENEIELLNNIVR